MNFIKVSDENLKALGQIEAKKKRIIATRDLILNYLASACEKYPMLQEAGITFSRPTPEKSSIIVTPFGNARTTYGWAINESSLIGKIKFEREQLDQYDKTFWEPIWGLSISDENMPYSSKSEDSLTIPLDDHIGNDRARAINSALLAILYGIINGPVIQKK